MAVESAEVADDVDSQPKRRGSGWGGVWTAADDFLARRRRTKWHRAAAHKPMPPRVYLDHRTLIRPVVDIRELRKGDHCLVAINLIRSLSPRMDYFVSCLGSIEICYMYHHFIMMDDVDHVDEHGIPWTNEGTPAEIMEYGNTIPEAWKEVHTTSNGMWWRVPFVAAKFLLDKSKCKRMPLADYGDTPHLYRVVESLTAEQREEIISKANGWLDRPRRYHVLHNNCEHVSNDISKGHFTSPSVHFALWSFFRFSLCCIGLIFLNVVGGACYSKICASYPLGAIAAYHIFACVPVCLQAAISYILIARSAWRFYSQSLINHDDYWHLVCKEFGRMVVVGGGAASLISQMPVIVSSTGLFLAACVTCMFGYMISDLFYNCCAHAVMRLVLLPVWGRVWLIGQCTETHNLGQVVTDIINASHDKRD